MVQGVVEEITDAELLAEVQRRGLALPVKVVEPTPGLVVFSPEPQAFVRLLESRYPRGEKIWQWLPRQFSFTASAGKKTTLPLLVGPEWIAAEYAKMSVYSDYYSEDIRLIVEIGEVTITRDKGESMKEPVTLTLTRYAPIWPEEVTNIIIDNKTTRDVIITVFGEVTQIVRWYYEQFMKRWIEYPVTVWERLVKLGML